jgi:hypothetical protein
MRCSIVAPRRAALPTAKSGFNALRHLDQAVLVDRRDKCANLQRHEPEHDVPVGL